MARLICKGKVLNSYILGIKPEVDNLEIKHYKCCGTTAKIKPLTIETGSYCPICGGIDYE